MDLNLDNIAKELYGKLESRFLDGLEFGDENGEVLTKEEDIPQARFFTFPYTVNGKTLGTITITLSETKGMVVQVGGDLASKKHPGVFKLIRSLSALAKPNLIKFKIVNLGKSALTKRDYEFQAKRKEETIMPPVTPVMESKFYGTSKISYQDLGEARIVIKHSQPVNIDAAAGRTMHIESIYVENAEGERFKYPYKHINGARALAEHLKHGGNPYDPIGKHITSLSEELAQLRKFKGYVGRNEALGEAMGDITSKVLDRIEQVKEQVQKLQRKAYYEVFAESFEEKEQQEIPAEIMDNWVDRLTIRTFNEELKSAFPYIFKLVSEADIPVKEISADDLLAEKSSTEKQARTMAAAAHDPAFAKKLGIKGSVAKEFNKADKGTKQLSNAMKHKKNKTESIADAFESFLNTIVAEDGDPSAITGKNRLFDKDPTVRSTALNDPQHGLKAKIAQQLPAGEQGSTALSALQGLIDTDEFANRVRALNAGSDVRPVIQLYLKDIADEKIHEPLAGDAKTAAEEILADGSLQWDGGTELGGGEQPSPEEPTTEPSAETPPEETPEPSADTGTPPEGAEATATPPEGEEPAPAVGQQPPPPVAEGANMAKLKAKFIKAKECGANLNTKIDFGHREMTLHDAIKECGFEASDVGFSADEHDGHSGKTPGEHEVWQSVEGFWDGQKSTIGATRMITRILKSAKEGQFQHATPEDIKMVITKIQKADPPSSVHGVEHDGELGRIKHLAGAKPHMSHASPEKTEMGDNRAEIMHHKAASMVPESEEILTIRKLSGL